LNRQEFLNRLGALLSALPRNEALNAIRYYDELILDAIDSGKNEEEFIASLGDLSDIGARIKADSSVSRAVRKPGMAAWTKALIAVLGICATPILLPVAIVLFVAAMVCVAVTLSVMITMIAVVAAIFAFVIWIFFVMPFSIGSVGLALFLTGTAVLAGIGAYYAIRGILKGGGILIEKIYNRIKSRKKRREGFA